ncbi:unnamed protein product [Cladocopium goreaui]|uniref:Ubiquitin thioesterase OTU1 n=1 Tax=Cladocopium goreaui TaxID=2562237 RepID=A0A9P1BFG5_9DINO|nr:unnamed protein product [Cladocopium goreaui]
MFAENPDMSDKEREALRRSYDYFRTNYPLEDHLQHIDPVSIFCAVIKKVRLHSKGKGRCALALGDCGSLGNLIIKDINVAELDLSPSSPTSPGPKSQAEAELLERKTTVMRLQNRLQKIFAKQLTPGKSVWCWRYEKNEVDHTFQASVHISLLDRSFTGGWAATHQAAQMEACNQLAAFLDRDFKA